MTVHETVAIAVRLFAAWLTVYLLQTIPSLVLVFEAEELHLTHAASIGAILCGFCAAALLWQFPSLVARRLMPHANGREPTFGATEKDFCRAGFIVLGVYLLSVSITDGVYLGLLILESTRNPMSTTDFDLERKAQIFATIAQSLLGIGLVVGSERVRKWVFKVRYE